MPVLPDTHQMEQIQAHCLTLFDRGEPLDALAVAQELLALPELPMHCPYHHFLVPAALLTSAHLRNGGTTERLLQELSLARQRAGSLPGGICGQYGCCGAGVGAGIFAAVCKNTTPLSQHGWAAVNEMTARCLQNIACVEGPRCCKRVTYLALQAAMPAAKELLGLDVGEFSDVSCAYRSKNRECRGKDCPFCR